MFTLIITLLFGITLGILLGTICSLYLLQIKCPQCKKLKPIKEIILWHWKPRACQHCQRPKSQIEL